PALVSPPPTPIKTPRGKVGSRTSSSTSLVSQRKKKGSNSTSTGNSNSNSVSSPIKSNSKAKVERKASGGEHTPPPSYSPGSNGGGSGVPGIMVPGPHGVPVFAPLVSYPPSSLDPTRALGATRTTRSRSTSKHHHARRDSTPPELRGGGEGYAAPYAAPYYMSPHRALWPQSAGSGREVPEDVDWYAPPPLPQPPPQPQPQSRHRSVSSAQYYRPGSSSSPHGSGGGGNDYDGPAPVGMPAAHARRHVSGPAYA
ncbi:hypothetical protein LTR53_018368, partial [Teratosphaeriaceae sp. CCFEE 6253]